MVPGKGRAMAQPGQPIWHRPYGTRTTLGDPTGTTLEFGDETSHHADGDQYSHYGWPSDRLENIADESYKISWR